MAIKVECTHCAAVLNLKDESKVGKRIKCPKCQQPFTIEVKDDEFSDEFGDLPDEEEVPAKEQAVPSKKKSGAKGKSGSKGGKGKGKGKKQAQGSGMLLPLLIGGGVLALLLIGGLVFFLTRGGDEPAVAENPVAPAEVAGEAPADIAPMEEAAKANAPEKAAPVANANSISTQYLTPDTQFIVHLKPSVLLKTPILQRVLTTDFGKNALASFKEQYGFGLEIVEEMTIGIAPDLKEIANFKPPGMGGNMSAEMESNPSADPNMETGADGIPTNDTSNPAMGGGIPAAPKMVFVMRMSNDVDLSQAKFVSGNETAMDDEAAMQKASGSSESSESTDAAKPVESRVYTVASTGMGPPLSLIMPDKRTLVMCEAKYLEEARTANKSPLGDKFAFVSNDETFVLTGLLDFVPFVKETMQRKGQEIPDPLQSFFKMYDQGAQAGYLALQLDDGVTVRSGLIGKDEAAATAIQTEFAAIEQLLKMQFAAKGSSLPPGFQTPLKETVDGFKVVQDKTRVQFEARLTTGLFDEVQTQAQKFGGQMAMAMAQGMLASKLGPGFSPGGFGGPGGGMPADMQAVKQDKFKTLEGEPVPSTAASGLPEGVELAAVLSRDPALPVGFHINLVLKGEAENIVQFKGVQLAQSTWDSGDALKTARGNPIKFSTSQTWDHTVSAYLKENMEPVTIVPLPVYASPTGQSVANLTGDVVMQSASKVEVLEVDLANAENLTSSEIEAAGIRIIPSGEKDATAYYILPASDGVAVVSVELVGAEKASQGQLPNFDTSLSEMPMQDEAQMSGEDGNTPSGSSSGAETVQIAEKVLGVTRPQYADPVGFVVTFEKQKASTISIRVASGLSDHEVHFEFADLPIPAAVDLASIEKKVTGNKATSASPTLSQSPPVWSRLAEGTSPPEGFTRIEANGVWEPLDEDSKSQTLNISIDLVGPSAERTLSVLRYGVDECIADDDKKLVFVEKADSLKDRKRLDRVDYLASSPLNTYRVTLPFHAVNPTFESLKSFKGELRLQVANEQVSVVVDKLKDYEGKRILQPDLLKEKIILEVGVDPETMELAFKLDSKSGTRVDSLTLTNDAGQRLPHIPQTLSLDDKGSEIFRFNIGEKTIKDFGVQIIFFQGNETVRVPFHFTDMPLPPPPVEE